MKVESSKIPILSSTDSDIIGGTAEVKYVPPAPNAPIPAAFASKPAAPASEPAPPVSKPALPASKPEPPSSKPPPPPTKPAPAKLLVVQEPKPEVEADDDVEPTPLRTPIPVTAPASVPLPKPGNNDKTENESSPKTAPDLEPTISSNENVQARRQFHLGCVAIEHLTGYRKQHRVDLVRPVLVGHRFCATPNHAIIVDGR